MQLLLEAQVSDSEFAGRNGFSFAKTKAKRLIFNTDHTSNNKFKNNCEDERSKFQATSSPAINIKF